MYLRPLAFTAILMLACGTTTAAQEISGTLYDRSGGTISGARVMLMSQDYVKLAETRSGERGEFSFQGLHPGFFLVQAKKPMFALAQTHVQLDSNDKAQLRMIAEVASAEEEITMTADPLPATVPLSSKAGVSRAGGTVEGWRPLRRTLPSFPESAKRRGANGSVVLLGMIKVDGSVSSIETLESPDAELEKVSRETFAGWRYSPMKLNGTPVEAKIVVVFNFTYK
jgi:TonB family protein